MSKPVISIRPLTASDAPAYRAARLFCLQTFPDRFGTLYEEEVGKDVLFFEGCLLDPECRHFMLGAFDGEQLIGLCGFVRETRVRTAHRGEIVQMYVHPGYQGLGIGTRLLRQTIDQALSLPGIEQIVLSLVADNEAALQLYRRLGFVEYGRLKQYFNVRFALD